MSEVRLIDANALKDIEYINKGNFNTVEGIREWIDNAPTVEGYKNVIVGGMNNPYNAGYMDGIRQAYKELERPKGEWILQYRTCGDEFYTCSLCERAIEVDYPQTLKDFPFCHCGADMRKEGE